MTSSNNTNTEQSPLTAEQPQLTAEQPQLTEEQAAEQQKNQELYDLKIREAKKQLKQFSKNQLISTIIQMSERAFYQEARIDYLMSQLNPNGDENAERNNDSNANPSE